MMQNAQEKVEQAKKKLKEKREDYLKARSSGDPSWAKNSYDEFRKALVEFKDAEGGVGDVAPASETVDITEGEGELKTVIEPVATTEEAYISADIPVDENGQVYKTEYPVETEEELKHEAPGDANVDGKETGVVREVLEFDEPILSDGSNAPEVSEFEKAIDDSISSSETEKEDDKMSTEVSDEQVADTSSEVETVE